MGFPTFVSGKGQPEGRAGAKAQRGAMHQGAKRKRQERSMELKGED